MSLLTLPVDLITAISDTSICTDDDISNLLENISKMNSGDISFNFPELSAKEIYVQSLIGAGTPESMARQTADIIWSKDKKSGKISENAKEKIKKQFENIRLNLFAKIKQLEAFFSKMGDSIKNYGNELTDMIAEFTNYTAACGSPTTAPMAAALPTKIKCAITQFSKSTNALLSQISCGLIDNVELFNMIQSLNIYGLIPKSLVNACNLLVSTYNELSGDFSNSLNSLQDEVNKAESDSDSDDDLEHLG